MQARALPCCCTCMNFITSVGYWGVLRGCFCLVHRQNSVQRLWTSTSTMFARAVSTCLPCVETDADMRCPLHVLTCGFYLKSSCLEHPLTCGSPEKGEQLCAFKNAGPWAQMASTNNVSCPEWLDWFHGGLQFQIECGPCCWLSCCCGRHPLLCVERCSIRAAVACISTPCTHTDLAAASVHCWRPAPFIRVRPNCSQRPGMMDLGTFSGMLTCIAGLALPDYPNTLIP